MEILFFLLGALVGALCTSAAFAMSLSKKRRAEAVDEDYTDFLNF